MHPLTPRPRLRAVLALALAAFVVAATPSDAGPLLAGAPTPPTPATPKNLPPGQHRVTPASLAEQSAWRARSLDRGHFTIGVRDTMSRSRLDWVPSTRIPFDSAYIYANGTGPGTPRDFPAAGAVAFARAARAAHALPVLSWYRMNGNHYGAQSRLAACAGACLEGDTAKRNLDHLGDPAFMQEYYLALAQSLQALDRDYGGAVVLHVEPDLSGYGQMLSADRTRCGSACTSGGGESPSRVRAAVASTRLVGLEKYPDTMQGFYRAVLHLRDLYAPRVSLSYHVSGWATAHVFRKSGRDDATNDINQGTRKVDERALAARVAQFAMTNGAATRAKDVPALASVETSRYDLLFNDVLDHDAAYAELVKGNPHYWWDTDNIDLPNFARWGSWLRGITSRTGLKSVVWQVPLGNTVYKVENNTFGHYQDNRAQYFFGHLEQLRSIGVSGIIFGAGNADSTWSLDRRHDGADNSRTVCTRRGSHSGTLRCPWKAASVTDDDGGYLRAAATAYFRHPLPAR